MSESPRLIVLDVVGLTPSLIGRETPQLQRIADQGSWGPLECPFPALTLSSQASILTGAAPARHGIVGNGWYFRELAEPALWRQPHALLQAEDLPTRLRREQPGFTVAKLFWWFNMYAPVDWAVTPRPMYPADGRKVPDVHTHPPELRQELQQRFGTFPLFHFWGPMADLRASRWIADASLALIREKRPHLSLVYLPHLDYDFQRFGPDDPRSRRALSEVDGLVGGFREMAEREGFRLVVLSEYGIAPVSRVVHPNRILREAGMITVRDELGTERLDCGASRAFALADHQIAHVYLGRGTDLEETAALFSGRPGIAEVLRAESRAAAGLDHPRSGDLVLVAAPDAWFSYYYWLDDARAPDYARTVDIHRKPGYDPAELFVDPALQLPKLRILRRLAAKKLGFRNLMDVIGLDPSIVRGSHGRRPERPEHGPVLISSEPVPDLRPEGSPYPLARIPDLLARLCGADNGE